jgi:NADPH:quinone reductase
MTSSPATMRAVRLSAPGPVDNLQLTTLPLPPERGGWVRIRVEAFGLNRSELKLRLGLGVGVSFPPGAGHRGRRHRRRGPGGQRAGSRAEGRRDDGGHGAPPVSSSSASGTS